MLPEMRTSKEGRKKSMINYANLMCRVVAFALRGCVREKGREYFPAAQYFLMILRN